jgi:hypothetical protein
MRVARAVAEIDDRAGEALAGPVKRAPGEASLTGGLDHVSRPDGGSGGGEVLEEPPGAEVELGRQGRRLDVLSLVLGGNSHALALKDQAAGDPGGSEPVDGREPVRDLVEGGVGAEGVFAGQQVKEGCGQAVLVLKAAGDLADCQLGFVAVPGAGGAGKDGAPGMVEVGGEREAFGGRAGEAVDDGLHLIPNLHGGCLPS